MPCGVARTSRLLFLLWMVVSVSAPASGAAPLRVSDNHRFLVRADGTPFFYLGDTAWELFHRLNREESERYLKNRAAKGFTVVQAVVLAELEGLTDPNPYGDLPLLNSDPTQPVEAYFRHVDFIVNKAEEVGLFIGMLPTWGRWVQENNIFTETSARSYGEFLGRRYKEKPIIWILGGDRNPNKASQAAIWRAMAEGITAGAGDRNLDRVLMTFHPQPFDLGSSSQWFHYDDWLDFNMHQNGHCTEVAVWNDIDKDYERTPVKPVMDGEPVYEDHPVCFRAAEQGYSNAADVRRLLYWELFAGGHGHTYGNHAVWQMWTPNRKPINGPLFPWHEALDRPGAGQMQHARALLESRPFLIRVPDQSVVIPAAVPFSVPGAGLKRVQATRGSDGSYAFVYIPAGQAVKINLEKISGGSVQAWWYNPRTGEAKAIGKYSAGGSREFVPPDPGESIDWVLVLDDATRNFPPPGRKKP